MTPDERAAGVASRQHGLITHGQAVGSGLSDDQVHGRIASGTWVLVVRGVHRIAGSPDTWRQRALAAQLAVAPAGGVTSHVTSGALHGLLRPSPLPHVTVPSSSSARCPIAKVHRSDLGGLDLTTVEGIRTTTVSRCVVDMAAVFDRASLEDLVDDAILGRRASPASILAALERAGRRRRGRSLLRAVVDAWTSAIEPGSHAEMRLLRRIADWGLPHPTAQHHVPRPDGDPYRIDVAWPEAMVALEYEGVRFHAVRRVDHDERRYRYLEAVGWRVVTASKLDLVPGERRLADRLLSLLGLPAAA